MFFLTVEMILLACHIPMFPCISTLDRINDVLYKQVSINVGSLQKGEN